jgi:parallel beta-helix repeat protein
MTITNTTPFPFILPPISNITPFTERDGTTYVELLYKIRDYINLTLRPEIDALLTDANNQYQSGVTNAENTITTYKTQIDSSIASFEANVNSQISAFEGTTNTAITQFETTTNNTVAQNLASMQTAYNTFTASINALIAGINAVPYWQANRAYTAGQVVFSPITGDPVVAKANFTSGTTYNPANWILSPNFVKTGQNFITPEAYGAKGDGTTDDSTALQNAANAAAAAGLPLWLTAPTYKLATSSYLTLPAGLTMMGPSTLSGTVSGAALIKVNGNTTLDGFTVINNGTGGRHNIYLQPGAVNVVLKNLKFTPAADNSCVGIQMSEAGIKNVRVDNCNFDGQSYGVLTNSGGTTATPTGAYDITDISIRGCRFQNMWADPIELNHPFNTSSDGTRTNATNFTIVGNVIHAPNGSGPSAGLGIGMAGVTDVTIQGNSISARTQGIHVEDDSTNVTIVGNTISNVKGSSAYAGIAILPSCRDIVISGNTIHDIGDSTTCNGIDIGFDGGNNHCKNVVIVGNTVRQVTGTGISVAANTGKGGYFRVANNVVRNCGSRGIAVLGTPDTADVHNNTIDTVTDYGVWVASYNTGIRVSGNTITNATAGDYRGSPLSSQNGTFIRDRYASWTTSNPSAGSVLTVPLFRLGAYADGTVHIAVQCYDSPGTRMDLVAKVRWDGTTLTYNRSMFNIYGTIGGGTLSVVNGVLTLTIGARPDGSTTLGQATFTGALMETGATYTGTVAGTQTSGTPAAAVDAATTQALVNDLRQKLINLGLVS